MCVIRPSQWSLESAGLISTNKPHCRDEAQPFSTMRSHNQIEACRSIIFLIQPYGWCGWYCHNTERTHEASESVCKIFLSGLTLGDGKEITVTGIADGHDTGRVQRRYGWMREKERKRRTRHGRAFQQLYQGRRWYRQSGGRTSLRAWRSTPTRICAEGGSCPRSRQA